MDIEALRDFVAVAAAGGVTGGARARGAPKQTVSRRIISLEAELGVRLLDRTTRSLRLTAEGRELNARATRLLADFDETARALKDRSAAPAGLVRISAPTLLGQCLLGPVAARVLREFPLIKLDISLEDRRVNLVEEGFDLAIRAGASQDSSLVGRTFAKAATIIVASPAVLAAGGAPRKPRDLEKFPCIVVGADPEAASWTLSGRAGTQSVQVTGRLAVSSIRLCLEAAIAGAGLANVPAFIARDAVQAGALARVLPGWRTGLVDLSLLYSSRRLLAPRLRAVIDSTLAEFTGVDFSEA